MCGGWYKESAVKSRKKITSIDVTEEQKMKIENKPNFSNFRVVEEKH